MDNISKSLDFHYCYNCERETGILINNVICCDVCTNSHQTSNFKKPPNFDNKITHLKNTLNYLSNINYYKEISQIEKKLNELNIAKQDVIIEQIKNLITDKQKKSYVKLQGIFYHIKGIYNPLSRRDSRTIICVFTEYLKFIIDTNLDKGSLNYANILCLIYKHFDITFKIELPFDKFKNRKLINQWHDFLEYFDQKILEQKNYRKIMDPCYDVEYPKRRISNKNKS